MFVDEKSKFTTPTEITYEPGTLGHLIQWLEKQPADKTYCWIDSGSCLFSQYGQYVTGLENEDAYAPVIEMFWKRYPKLMITWNGVNGGYEPFGIGSGTDPLIGLFDSPYPNTDRTFSAALERARIALQKHG